MKTILKVFTILFFTASIVNAQEKVDLFGISFMHNTKVGLKDPTNAQLENLDLNVSELDAFVRYPIQLKNDKTVLVNTIKYHFVRAPFDDLPSNESFEANLHSIQYDFTIRHKLSDTWLGLVSLRPTLASNFKDGIGTDDFFFQGMVGFKYLASKSMSYGVGVSYINGFGEPKTVPVLLFDYKTNKLNLEVKAPILLNVHYSTKRITYGLEAKLEGGQYHLANDENSGPVVTNNETVKFSRYNVGPTLGWKFDDHSRFEVSAGISLKRTLKAIDNAGIESDYDLENGLFFKTAFYFGK